MQVTGNLKYISGVSQYVVDGNDGILNVDTSVYSVTIILPNILNSGYANTNKGFIINDISDNAGTNNIYIVANGNTVNSTSQVIINVNGGSAKCTPANNTEWFVVTEPVASSTSDKNYVYTQTTPSDTWTVNHNLDKRCSVQVVDDTYKEIIADITWVSNNTVTVEFNTATTGYVYCN